MLWATKKKLVANERHFLHCVVDQGSPIPGLHEGQVHACDKLHLHKWQASVPTHKAPLVQTEGA